MKIQKPLYQSGNWLDSYFYNAIIWVTEKKCKEIFNNNAKISSIPLSPHQERRSQQFTKKWKSRLCIKKRLYEELMFLWGGSTTCSYPCFDHQSCCLYFLVCCYVTLKSSPLWETKIFGTIPFCQRRSCLGNHIVKISYVWFPYHL